MSWRIGVGCVFLLVLLACVLYLVFTTMPPTHTKPPKEKGVLVSSNGGSPTWVYDTVDGIEKGYAYLNNWRPMDDTEKSMPSNNSLTQDASGNIFYRPYF